MNTISTNECLVRIRSVGDQLVAQRMSARGNPEGWHRDRIMASIRRPQTSNKQGISRGGSPEILRRVGGAQVEVAASH